MTLSKNEYLYPTLGVVGIIALIFILRRYDKFKQEGGLVNEVGEAILGEPGKTEILKPSDTFSLSVDDLARKPHLPGGLWVVITKPNWNDVVNRTSYFGSEIELTFTIKNLNDYEVTLPLSLSAIEDDIRPDYQRTIDLGVVIIPPKKGVRIDGYYDIATRTILTGRLTVTLSLNISGEQFATTQFEVA